MRLWPSGATLHFGICIGWRLDFRDTNIDVKLVMVGATMRTSKRIGISATETAFARNGCQGGAKTISAQNREWTAPKWKPLRMSALITLFFEQIVVQIS